MDAREKEIEKLKDYKYGFSTDIENTRAPKGLNEEVIKFISNIKKEPQWMLDWRLKAFERLKQLKEPNWQKPKYPKIDYQDLYYYSAPKSMDDKPKSLDELDPKLLETYNKLGIPLQEQARLNGIAVDAVFDSVSVATTFKGELNKKGIIFCSMSEAIQDHPELVKKYLGSVIPISDHYFATLNSASPCNIEVALLASKIFNSLILSSLIFSISSTLISVKIFKNFKTSRSSIFLQNCQ